MWVKGPWGREHLEWQRFGGKYINVKQISRASR